MKNITILTWIIITSVAMQSCYTYKPMGKASAPDYNKRVSVTDAQMQKKSNAMNVVFKVSLAGAGGVGGYYLGTALSTEKGSGALGAVLGASGGITLSYLCDAIAGVGKRKPVTDPALWIKRSKKEFKLNEYKLLSGSGKTFTIIHPSAESSFIVQNIQDVNDFKKVFPQSTYTERMIDRALGKLPYNDFSTLDTWYPQYSLKIRTKGWSLCIIESSTFNSFKNNWQLFPEICKDINFYIDYTNETQLKTLFAQLDNHSEEIGKEKLRRYKNEILDKLTIISTDIDLEYETAQYEKLPTNTTDYELIYSFTQRFPNSKYSANLNSKADKLKYNEYFSLYSKILKEEELVNESIATNTVLSVNDLENLLKIYEKFEGYDPDNKKTVIAIAKTTLERGRSLSAYFDVEREVVSLMQKIANNQWGNSSLREKIQHFNNTSNSTTTYSMKNYVESASKFCTVIEATNIIVPNSYKEFSTAGAVLGLIGTIFSGNVSSMGAAVQMNNALAQEHINSLSNAMDIILNYFGHQNKLEEMEIFGEEYIYIWYNLTQRLIAKEEEVVTTYNRGVESANKVRSFLRDIDGAGSSGSSSYSSSKEKETNIDPDKVSIPSYKIITAWTKRAALSSYAGDEYLEAKFDDGTYIEISRYKSDNLPFIDITNLSPFGNMKYKTDDDAIKAAYVYKKYRKTRTIGKK